MDHIASVAVTPAGGTAGAVVAAVGASLCEMAAIHTLQDTDTDVDREAMAQARSALSTHRETLLDLADADARVVASVFGDSEDTRDSTAITQATGIPLGIAESCLHILEEAESVIAMANTNVVPDALTGVFVTQAALQASLFTVQTNFEYLDDRTARDEFDAQVTEIETRSQAIRKRLAEQVETVEAAE
jgi:formiminotetrahydrofolate cyclodeaminase